MYKSQLKKKDPYDWFCGPGSHIIMEENVIYLSNLFIIYLHFIMFNWIECIYYNFYLFIYSFIHLFIYESSFQRFGSSDILFEGIVRQKWKKNKNQMKSH